MSFTDTINGDLRTAMKAKDQVAMRTLRAIKSAILLAKTDGTGEEMTEAKGTKILQKLMKQRKESLDIYEKQGREVLAAVERAEMSVIEKYLPEAMSEADIEKAVQEVIAQTGATSMKDMGKVMGMASKKLAGQADGSVISGIVKKLLS